MNSIINRIKSGNVPSHVAIIMDGNGRWAKKQGKPRIYGHRKGVDTVRDILFASRDIGVKYLSLFAFSTENWNRPEDEINSLWKLLKLFLKKEFATLKKNRTKLKISGDISRLPVDLQKEINNTINSLKIFDDFVLNFCLNYGSRAEIVNAVKLLCRDLDKKIIKLDDIDEAMFSQYLYTADLPDPELLIRTSGEYRLSNFLLYQIAYSEIYISKKYWPEFTSEDYFKVILDFQKRERRFGGVK